MSVPTVNEIYYLREMTYNFQKHQQYNLIFSPIQTDNRTSGLHNLSKHETVCSYPPIPVPAFVSPIDDTQTCTHGNGLHEHIPQVGQIH